MACVVYQGTVSEGDVYQSLEKSNELCGASNTAEQVLLTAADYTDLIAYTEFKKFDAETYDTAFMGTLSMWAVGIGVGLVLAMLAKLKR